MTTAQRPRGLLRLATVSLALLVGGSVLGGCSARGDARDGFPDPARAGMPEGMFVDLDHVREFSPGLTKRQLYALLGTPHFNEGMWGVREWNYLFNIRRDGGQTFYQCQLRIRFDGSNVATAGDWYPESCRALINPPAPPPPSPPPAPEPLAEPLQLSGDTLFEFDSDVLSAAGRASLDVLVSKVSAASQVQDITVRGYADRIGSAAYNLDLSSRRAQSVRQYLVSRGVPGTAMSAEGLGSRDPVVGCEGVSSNALVDCLAPNRRVEISGSAVR